MKLCENSATSDCGGHADEHTLCTLQDEIDRLEDRVLTLEEEANILSSKVETGNEIVDDLQRTLLNAGEWIHMKHLQTTKFEGDAFLSCTENAYCLDIRLCLNKITNRLDSFML